MEIETTTRIRNVEDMKLHIAVLERRMDAIEKQLKKDVREVYLSLQVRNMVKNALREIKDDPTIRGRIVNGTLGIGAQFLIDRVLFRKRKGLKGFLVNEGIKRLLTFYLSKNRRNILKNAVI
jgi:hypothetical protein